MAVKTFLLAAGLGTRLRPYTLTHPKPSIPFLGVPMMNYGLFLSEQSGFKNIVINTHQFPEKIHKLAIAASQKRLQLQFSHEEPAPLGSGGALFAATQFLQDTDYFFVINGDCVFVPQKIDIFKRLLAQHESSNALATLVVSTNEQLINKFNPLWIDTNGNVQHVGRKSAPPANTQPAHYIGLKIFNKEILKFIPSGSSNIFTDVLIPLIARGYRVHTMNEEALWWETGDFPSYFQASCEAMQLIHAHRDNHFFSRVYHWLGKDFSFRQIRHDQNIIFSHLTSTIPLEKIRGSAFIDAHTTALPDVQIDNSIVDASCHLTTNINDTLILGDTK
ncbi:MAG: NTP transferase domain-containing protein [Bdellovibrionaceae bacterium]|nr:NTP transferase domain-containing protein [Pseudobdellovibrionaceae bacterium]